MIVRPFQGDGVRVTIGTPEENDAFLAVAEAALDRGRRLAVARDGVTSRRR